MLKNLIRALKKHEDINKNFSEKFNILLKLPANSFKPLIKNLDYVVSALSHSGSKFKPPGKLFEPGLENHFQVSTLTISS